MSQHRHLISRVSPGLFVSLFLLFISIYLASYSGRIESSDSLRVVDTASSLVHFGDTRRDESLWQEAPRNIIQGEAFPFSEYEPAEPLVTYVASIPYAIASILPSVGLVHATWLLNIIILSLSGLLWFYLAHLLNYDTQTALIGTILTGIGTILWAYSKTLFRDPLVIFFFLLVAIFLELWRQDYRRVWWLITAILAGIGAYFTKNSSIVALLAFAIWILPDWQLNKMFRRILDIALAGGLILIILIAFVPLVFDFFAEFVHLFISSDLTFARIALHSYLFSIGGSLAGTSPILLSAIAGGFLLIRQNQRRLLWSVISLVLVYAFGHALLTGVHWFGGLSLPPRFMLASIPFVMLLTLPVIEMLFKRDTSSGGKSRRNWQLQVGQWLFIALAVFSIAVQFIFSVSLMDGYVEVLPPEANGLVEWLPGLNQIGYLRWQLLPQTWSSLGWDIAWTRIDADYIGISFVILAILSAVALISRKYSLWLNTVITIGVLVVSGIGFRQLYQRDTYYQATTPELFEMLAILETEATPIEPLFLAGSADVTYERFILNYNHLDNVRPVVIGFAPGERASPSDTSAIESDFTTDLISVTILRYLDRVISYNDHFWWLAHNSSFTEWAIRPEERFFTENYYLLNEYSTGNPTVRLLEFSSVQAPDRYNFRLPDYLSDFRFGDSIRLAGYSLPSGMTYYPRDDVPVTFFWQTESILADDYTVSWFLVHAEGWYLPIQGLDSIPDAGFSPTFSWETNQLIFDNRAITLPADVPPGQYQLWVRLYQTGSGGTVQLPVSGGDTYDETTAILPIRIDVIND